MLLAYPRVIAFATLVGAVGATGYGCGGYLETMRLEWIGERTKSQLARRAASRHQSLSPAFSEPKPDILVSGYPEELRVNPEDLSETVQEKLTASKPKCP